jgi:hypothetical protein
MSGDRISLDRAQTLARVRRFGSLRAAQRAITPSVRSGEALPDRSEVRRLRERLQPLYDGARPGTSSRTELPRAELAAIDAALDAMAQTLRAALKKISMAQLRATLEPLEGDQRREAIALLDLCLEDEENLGPWLPMTDLLITRLASTECDGLRTVVTDPVDLSPRLRELCAAAEGRDEAAQAEAVSFFCSAAERIRTDDEFDAVVREVFMIKQQLKLRFFAPEVLRCIVFYNVTVANQRGEALRAARAEDRELEDETQPMAAASGSSRPLTVPSHRTRSAPGASSVFDSYGLDALEEACERRFRNGPPLPGAAGEVAGAFAWIGMKSGEAEIFHDFSNDPLPRLMRRIVTVGLVLQHQEEVQKHLDDLEIRSDLLSGEWISELGDATQSLIDACIASGSYEEANRLSDLKTRFLYGTLSARRSEQREERPGTTAAAPTAEAPGFLRSLDRGNEKAPARLPKSPGDDASASGQTRPPRLRALALAAVLLAVTASAGVRLLESQEGAARVLPVEEIRQLSPYLLSGYRSDEGRGDVFIGNIDERWWDDLEATERAALASLLAERLGVRELQLFDRTRSLRARWVSGEITFPGEHSS